MNTLTTLVVLLALASLAMGAPTMSGEVSARPAQAVTISEQRQLKSLLERRRALHNEKVSLMGQATRMTDARDATAYRHHLAERELAEATHACELVRTHGATGDKLALCDALRTREGAVADALSEYQAAERAVVANDREFRKAEREMNGVQEGLLSMRKFYYYRRPRPSVVPRH